VAFLSAAAQAVTSWRMEATARGEAAGWPAAVPGPQTALLLDVGFSAVLRPCESKATPNSVALYCCILHPHVVLAHVPRAEILLFSLHRAVTGRPLISGYVVTTAVMQCLSASCAVPTCTTAFIPCTTAFIPCVTVCLTCTAGADINLTSCCQLRRDCFGGRGPRRHVPLRGAGCLCGSGPGKV
jgi:hypothetical protein